MHAPKLGCHFSHTHPFSTPAMDIKKLSLEIPMEWMDIPEICG
jgi:hypothetical protein